MLHAIPEGPKKELLLLIKRKGELSLEEAEAISGLAKTTLRQHLIGLEEQSLILRAYRTIGQGRPIVVFKLSENGSRLFPSQESLILREMLQHLQETGHKKLIEDFFHKYWSRRKQKFEEILISMAGKKRPDRAMRLKALEHLLESEGFMPEIEKQGATIRKCNCPFAEVVKVTQLPCKLEGEFIKWALKQELERTAYIPAGDFSCDYSEED